MRRPKTGPFLLLEVRWENKLALKLFYKVWSGFTKYIRSQCKQGRVFSSPFIGKFCTQKEAKDQYAYAPSLDFIESANFKYEENESNLSPFTSFKVGILGNKWFRMKM